METYPKQPEPRHVPQNAESYISDRASRVVHTFLLELDFNFL